MPWPRDAIQAVALDESSKIEQDLLGTLMVHASLLPTVRDQIKDFYFCDMLHREIYSEMLKLSDVNAPLRPKTLVASMGKRATDTAKTYIAMLGGHAVAKESIPWLVKQLRNGWAMRETQDALQQALDVLDQGKVFDPVKLITKIVENLDPVLQAGLSETMRAVTVGEMAQEVLRVAKEARTQAPNDRAGILTGIASLDDILRPMMPGQLLVALGRPGQGKSALACTIALNAAKRGVAVLMDSLEMSAFDLTERMLSAIAAEWNETRYRAQIPYSTMSGGGIDDTQYRAMENAAEYLNTLPITIEQQPGLTVAQIAARARMAHAKAKAAGIKKFILIIDYLGLVKPGEDYRGSKVNEIGEITMSLKVLAKELAIPILLLCQMNRGAEQREDKRPLLADARDSGSIEQDADVILGVYREHYYLAQRKDLSFEDQCRMQDCISKAEIGVLKQRKGKTGWVIVGCDMATNIISG